MSTIVESTKFGEFGYYRFAEGKINDIVVKCAIFHMPIRHILKQINSMCVDNLRPNNLEIDMC